MSNKAKQMAKSERAASSRYIADTHEQILREAQGLVKAAAMAIRWSRVSAHQNVFLHVMLDDLDGRRLLNWWPRKRSYWCPGWLQRGMPRHRYCGMVGRYEKVVK